MPLKAQSQGVDLASELEYIERGDEIRLVWKTSTTEGLIDLLRLISSGAFEVKPLMRDVLMLVLQDGAWARGDDRSVTMIVKDLSREDRNRFIRSMSEVIQSINVARRRPLVDLTALQYTHRDIRFRLKTDGILAVEALLQLHELEAMELHRLEMFKEVLLLGEWVGEGCGATFRIDKPNFGEKDLMDYFEECVIPHLEYLRLVG